MESLRSVKTWTDDDREKPALATQNSAFRLEIGK